jgi:hypothetical protein
VENLLSAAKTRYQERQSSLPRGQKNPNAPLEPQDFDPEFDRSKDAASNLVKLFEDMVGAEGIIEKLRKWQQMAKIRRAMGKDLQTIPTSFIFKGPPGTSILLPHDHFSWPDPHSRRRKDYCRSEDGCSILRHGYPLL